VDESKEYNYLLSLPLWNLTFEKVEEMKRSRQEKENELKTLEMTHIKELWKADLHAFLEMLDKVELEEEEDRKKGDDKAKAGNKGIKAKKNNKKEGKEKDKAKPEKKAINWDTDGESEVDLKEKPKEQQKAKKSGKDGASKKEAKESKEKSDDNDLISRVKRKL
jgi:DNA topoisomerase II